MEKFDQGQGHSNGSDSVNVCLDDIFWTAEHFVTKLGMVMQHDEPECHVEKDGFLSSRSRLQ